MDSHSLEDPYVQDSKKLESILDNLEKRSHQLEERASRLSANYVIFDGIICIPSILASSSSLEKNRWILICLSVSVSISFWVTIITTVIDGMRLRFQWDLVLMEKARLHRRINYYLPNGQTHDAVAVDDLDDLGLNKPFAIARYKRYACVGVVLSGLLAFTVLVLYALSSNP